MTKERRISLAAILGISFFTQSFATLWTGSITETVTQTSDAAYQVGSVFCGYYSYESETMDGTFYGDHLSGVPDGANCSLGGLIFMPFVTTANIDLGPFGGPVITRTGGMGPTYACLDANDRVAHLNVLNGIVSLSWIFDNGFVFTVGGGNFDAISFDSGLPVSGPDVRGKIEYGAPKAVPEGASTISLLFSAALLGSLFKCRGGRAKICFINDPAWLPKPFKHPSPIYRYEQGDCVEFHLSREKELSCSAARRRTGARH